MFNKENSTIAEVTKVAPKDFTVREVGRGTRIVMKGNRVVTSTFFKVEDMPQAITQVESKLSNKLDLLQEKIVDFSRISAAPIMPYLIKGKELYPFIFVLDPEELKQGEMEFQTPLNRGISEVHKEIIGQMSPILNRVSQHLGYRLVDHSSEFAFFKKYEGDVQSIKAAGVGLPEEQKAAFEEALSIFAELKEGVYANFTMMFVTKADEDAQAVLEIFSGKA